AARAEGRRGVALLTLGDPRLARRGGSRGMRIGRVESVWGGEALGAAGGWKVWRVDAGLLRSVLSGDLWPVEDPVEAVCRRQLRSRHDAPSRGCECGIHAGRELGAWDPYLAGGAGARGCG